MIGVKLEKRYYLTMVNAFFGLKRFFDFIEFFCVLLINLKAVLIQLLKKMFMTSVPRYKM